MKKILFILGLFIFIGCGSEYVTEEYHRPSQSFQQQAEQENEYFLHHNHTNPDIHYESHKRLNPIQHKIVHDLMDEGLTAKEIDDLIDGEENLDLALKKLLLEYNTSNFTETDQPKSKSSAKPKISDSALSKTENLKLIKLAHNKRQLNVEKQIHKLEHQQATLDSLLQAKKK